MNRKSYNTDGSDVEWAILEPLIPAVQLGGRPRFRSMREADRYIDSPSRGCRLWILAAGRSHRCRYHANCAGATAL